MIGHLFAWLRGLFRRRQIGEEIAEELRDHLEREVEMHRSRGLSADEARRLALRDLGGLTQTLESTRDVRATWLDTLWRDARYAMRVLWRSRRFSVTALTLLVLAVGSTTAIYPIAYAVLVRPLPYPEARRLVFVAEKESGGIAWPDFEDLRRRASSFEDLASSLADAIIMTSGQVPRRFDSRSVTSNFFHVLRVPAFQGRLFDDSDTRPDAAATAVVSHAFWMREFGGGPAAVGQTIAFNRRPFTVIGVLPPGFRYMSPADVYILLEPQVAANYRGMLSRRNRTALYAIGRLKPEIDITAAQTETHGIAAALALEYPDTNKGHEDMRLIALRDRVVGGTAPTLAVIAGAVTLLLLIACVNLAVLLLNRSTSRAHEFSIRAAIGGSRWSLVRQVLIELALLILTGGVLGALSGAAILTGLISVAPPDVPRLDEIRPDFVVLSSVTLFSCACLIVFAIVPALKASTVKTEELVLRSARGATRSAASLRRALTIAQIAVAMVLLSGSGLMVQTMLRLARVDPGFDPHNLQTLRFSLTGPEWPDTRKQVFYDTVVDRLRAVPGVENAALTYSLPMLGSFWWNRFSIPDKTEHWIARGEFPNAGMAPVTEGYFETLRIPLIKGRYFDRSDTPDSQPVAIVNSALARKYWPDEDPIGKQLRQGPPSEPYGPWRTIVGVVGDITQEGIDRERPQQIFMPIVQQPRSSVFAIARTHGPFPSASLEAAIHEIDRNIPVFNDRTIDQLMREASSRRRIAMIVLSIFGGVSVLLAAIGLYSVIAQGVAERRHEIGVRVALGATPGEMVRLFLRQGLTAAAVGIGCGVVAALAAARSLATLVFGVTATDPATLGTVAALLMMVTLLACYVPARSATRVDPSEALRSE